MSVFLPCVVSFFPTFLDTPRVHPFDARMRRAELPAPMSWEDFRQGQSWDGMPTEQI